MTQITTLFDPALVGIDGVLSRREALLRALILQNGTVANAEDINEIQGRIEQALQAFGADVDFSMGQLLLLLTTFTNSIRREQANFEARVEADLAAMRAEMRSELTAIRREFALADAAVLKAAKEYTDAAIIVQNKKTIDTLIEASKTTVGVTTPELYDNGIQEAGRNWPITVYTVPPGHTFYVHRWTYSHRQVQNPWYTNKQLRVNWDNFMGYRDFSSQLSAAAADSGTFSKDPLFTIPAGGSSTATVFINNLTAICTFQLEGYLIADSLQAGQA